MEHKETKGITAVFIIEVLGRPAEHLVETLENISKELENEPGVNLISKNVKEPVLMKDQKDFYTDFVEAEIEIEDIMHLVALMFKYMPAHVEIIEPEFIALTNGGWGEVLNEITRKLHAYDEIAKVIQIEKGILEKKLREVLESKKDVNEKPKEKKSGKKKN